jgi:hypothetical protein
MRTVEEMLQPERPARMVEIHVRNSGDDTYAPPETLGDLRDGVWSELEAGGAIGPYRRSPHRGHLKATHDVTTAEVDSPDLPGDREDRVVRPPGIVHQSDIRAPVRRECRGDVNGGLGRAPNEMTERPLQEALRAPNGFWREHTTTPADGLDGRPRDGIVAPYRGARRKVFADPVRGGISRVRASRPGWRRDKTHRSPRAHRAAGSRPSSLYPTPGR